MVDFTNALLTYAMTSISLHMVFLFHSLYNVFIQKFVCK